MWSAALNKAAALVDQGISQANQFLEELDKADDEEEDVENEDEDDGNPDIKETLPVTVGSSEDKSIAEVPSASSTSVVASTAAGGGEDGEFYTPLKTPALIGRTSRVRIMEEKEVHEVEEEEKTVVKVKPSQSSSAGKKNTARVSGGQQNEVIKKIYQGMSSSDTATGVASDQGTTSAENDTNKYQQMIAQLREENSRLQTKNTELENTHLYQKDSFQREMAQLRRGVDEERALREKAEAETAHIKKVAISPKVNKENLKMIDILKKENNDLEREMAALKERVEEDKKTSSDVITSTANEDEVSILREQLKMKASEMSSLESKLHHMQSQMESLEEQVMATTESERSLMTVLQQRETEHKEEVRRLVHEDEERLASVAQNLEAALDQLEQQQANTQQTDTVLALETANSELQEQVATLGRNYQQLVSDRAEVEVRHAAEVEALRREVLQREDLLGTRAERTEQLEAEITRLQQQIQQQETGRQQSPQEEAEAEDSSSMYKEEISELHVELEELTERYHREVEEFRQKEDRYTAHLLALQTESSAASEEVHSLQAQLERQVGELQQRLQQQHEEEVAALQSNLTSLRSQLEEAQTKLLVESRVTDENYVRPASAASLLSEEALVDLKRQHEDEKRELHAAVQILEEQLETVRSEYQAEVAQLTSLLEKVRASSQRDRDALDSDLHTARVEQDALQSELQKARVELEGGQKQYEELQSKYSFLGTAFAELESSSRWQVDALQQECVGLQELLTSVQHDLSEAEMEVSHLQEENARVEEEVQGTVTAAGMKIAALESQLEGLRQVVQEGRHEVERRLDEVRRDTEDRTSGTYQSKLSALERELAEAQQRWATAEQAGETRYQSLLAAAKEEYSADLQERIITNAALSERVHYLSSELDASRLTVDDLSARYRELETLQQSTVAHTLALENSLQMKEEALVASATSLTSALSAIEELKETNNGLQIEMQSMAGANASKESGHAALLARAEEAEAALAALETKKKRDLEFLRKQNESISALQRQVEELRQSAGESEAEHSARLQASEKRAADAGRLAERLRESLTAAQADIQTLKAQLASAERARDEEAEEERVEVLSNYVDSSVTKNKPSSSSGSTNNGNIASPDTALLQRELLKREEAIAVLEHKLTQTMREHEATQQTLTVKVDELQRGLKVSTAHAAALEEERERLEGELRGVRRSLNEVQRVSGGSKDWAPAVAVRSSVYTDIENATSTAAASSSSSTVLITGNNGGMLGSDMRGEEDEGGKKEHFGTPWVLLYVYNQLIALVPRSVLGTTRPEHNRAGMAIIVYLVIFHALLLRCWLRGGHCASASLSPPLLP